MDAAGGAGPHNQRGEERGGLLQGLVPWRGAMGLEEVEEMSLVLFGEALEFDHFSKVGIGFVGDVDEVGLD